MSCINACDAAGPTSCQHANFQYSTVGEPALGAASTLGLCTFVTGYATPTGAGNLRYAVAVKATAASTVGCLTTTPSSVS